MRLTHRHQRNFFRTPPGTPSGCIDPLAHRSYVLRNQHKKT
jgi:hypothetical protein